MSLINWTNYLFHANFTPHAEGLAGLEVAEEIPLDQRMVLVSALNDIDKSVGRGLWITEGPDKLWNLTTASITYNGQNSRDFATNSKYNSVLVLSFGKESETPQGRLYLQYNREGV
ncbi:hypothetical protein D3C76_25960 [compost metagenome]